MARKLSTRVGFTDSIFVRHHGNYNNQNLTPSTKQIASGITAAPLSLSNISNKEYDHKEINQYLDDCEHQLRVRLEHKNRFMFTIIFDKKNRYIAWTGKYDDRPVLKNLDGMSRKYPK